VNLLCIGETCINESQLKALLSASSMQATTGAPAGGQEAPAVSGEGVRTHDATTTPPTVSSSSPAVLFPANDHQELSGDDGYEDEDAQNHQSNSEPQPEETSTDQHPASPQLSPRRPADQRPYHSGRGLS
jgi:hypothetical protein